MALVKVNPGFRVMRVGLFHWFAYGWDHVVSRGSDRRGVPAEIFLGSFWTRRRAESACEKFMGRDR